MGEQLNTAMNEYITASDSLAEAAVNELIEKIEQLAPEATHAKVTGFVVDDYSEHSILVFNGDERIDIDDALEEDPDWFMTVTEGICINNDYPITVILPNGSK